MRCEDGDISTIRKFAIQGIRDIPTPSSYIPSNYYGIQGNQANSSNSTYSYNFKL